MLASMKNFARLLGSEGAGGEDLNTDEAISTLTNRNTQLEAALAEERKKCAQKDEEIIKMQKLMSKLEATMDQQAHMSELEKERLNSLEEALGQRQQEQDQSASTDKEQINKLAMALTEAKKRAEQESARADQLQKEVDSLREVVNSEIWQTQSPELVQSDSAGPLAEKLEERTRQVASLQKQLEEQMSANVSAGVDYKEQELALKKKGNAQSLQIQEYEQKVLDLAAQKADVLDKARSAEAKHALAQVQLAEELKARQSAQTQLAEKEQQLKSFREVFGQVKEDQPFDRLSQQQAIQEQVIEKEREVCDLQQQLADELSKRQAVQYQIIEKDRSVCELQASLSAMMNQQGGGATQGQAGDPAAEASYLHTIEEDSNPSEQLSKTTHRSYIPNGLGSHGGSIVAPSVSNKRLPPWLASPAVETRATGSRITLPSHSGSHMDKPVWVGHGPAMSQASSTGTHYYGAYAPSQPGPAPIPGGCIARSRAYIAGSPRAPFTNQSAIARRLSQGSATFT